MTDAASSPGRQGAQTLERGLALLGLVVEESRNARDLAVAAGLGLPTTRRLLASLADQGFIAIDRNRLYRAGPRLLELGARGRDQVNIVAAAQPHLNELSAVTGAPSFLGERDRDHSVHLYRAQGSQRVMVSTPVGTRRLLPETSLGRALLLQSSESEWEELFAAVAPNFRPDGWLEAMRQVQAADMVIHDTPAPDRLRAVACPIRDASGDIVAAISIVSPLQYASDAEIEQIVPEIRAAAEAISGELGYVAGQSRRARS